MMEQDYKVTFTGEYFSTVVHVPNVEVSKDEPVDFIEARVAELAEDILKYNYGIDIMTISTVDLEIEEV
jgi:hypothetical protein